MSLLFCGICFKHYAYHNMSRRTQLTIKFMFQILSQLSENFIFIYLGVSLFAETKLDFRAPFILITVIGVCASRWMAVFPLSWLLNSIGRYQARRRGTDPENELMPWSYQAMLFWAGLRGAVGVALAAEFTGPKKKALQATVLVVVVLTVIIFGGTTSRMLEILNIRTGVVEDVDSDDEFDIEVVRPGTYAKRSGAALGYNPKPTDIPLSAGGGSNEPTFKNGIYSTARGMPPDRPNSAMARKTSSLRLQREEETAAQGLLSPHETTESDDEGLDLDLPPSARRAGASGVRREVPVRTHSAPAEAASSAAASAAAEAQQAVGFRQFFQGSAGDPATWFRNLDEDYIKPTLLLDPKDGSKGPGAV